MRVASAGARARLVLILMLLVATIAGSVSPTAAPVGSPAESVSAAKSRDTKSDDASRRDRRGSRDNNQRRARRAPAALDAGRIAAANAATIEALECGDLIAIPVGDRVYCTHGEDPEPPVPGARENAGRAESAPGPLPRALCLDDGVSGHRVQIVYVHRNDRPNRLGELLTRFRRLAAEMDLIFDQSAGKTGDSLRVRYATDAQCNVDVDALAASPSSLKSFGGLLRRMKSAGYDDLDRKYLMLVDDRVFCGVGTFAGGAQADNRDTEAHDFTGYARVDLPCWDAGSMAHEISHTLGAVQYSSPHTSRGGHCIDEWDVMCYSDEPHKPAMQFLCKAGLQDFRLD